MQDNEKILEAYVKSWTTGALDKAVRRGSIAFTVVLHHLSTFIFGNHTGEKLALRNKLAKSILRDYSRKQQHEVGNFVVSFYFDSELEIRGSICLILSVMYSNNIMCGCVR